MSGKQSREYSEKYYADNKERILKRNKALYLKKRSTPEGLKKHREQSLLNTKRYREKHRERVNASMRKTHMNRKKRMFEKLGGAFCVRCGCDELIFLEINHKNGGGCREFKENKASLSSKILSGERKTDDLECLCRVCNALDFLERKNKEASKRFVIHWREDGVLFDEASCE